MYSYSLEESLSLNSQIFFTEQEYLDLYSKYKEYRKSNDKFNFCGYLLEYYDFHWPDFWENYFMPPENFKNYFIPSID